jgi:hypothetical protein
MSQPDQDRGESDVEPDPHVAASRADRDEDGSYVGRKSGDDDFDSDETGAERRATEG